ncbi:hypothetical protein [Corallococcus carmarthensis]|uniref:Uncharacterized protein n=1 Tax=Corallococcus carmarthensis TaxID=2316728 RepID=A0A3A8K9F0_9BACT|nr:hypothetical protein [Corallococcus carmarthensis]NOK19824.1 hypothetical protein [Corallococcus carmarthensis]RKG98423.1 hypothetical protein D7X32_29685 [Corallococcus carmarthensis]
MAFLDGAAYYVTSDVDFYSDPFLKKVKFRKQAGSTTAFTVVDITKRSVKVKSSKSGNTFFVDPADDDCFQPAMTMFPTINLPSKVENLGQKEKRKVKALPLTKTGKIKRDNFESIPTPTFRPFDYKPDSKTTGAVREPQIEHRVLRGDVHDFELISTHTGKKIQLSGTYCTYCHRWFETYTLDSDHIVTAEEIGQWLQAMEKLLDANEAFYKAALTESLTAQSRSFKDFFFKTKKGSWKGSAQGMLQLFNNVDNLVLSCKICNQMSKNRTTGRQMLSSSITFGKDFEEDHPMGLEGTLATLDGGGFATKVDAFNQTPRNRKSIDLHGAVFRGSMKRENRVNEMLVLSVKGDSLAEGKERKEKALTRVLDTMDDEFASDEEDSDLEDLLASNMKETLQEHSLGRQRSMRDLIDGNRAKQKQLKKRASELELKNTQIAEQKRKLKRKRDELDTKDDEIDRLENQITLLKRRIAKLKS